MKWFKNLFRKEDMPSSEKRDREDLNKSVRYMYMLIGSQIALVFLITGFIMFVGAIISTPFWILLGIFLMAFLVCIHLYRKAKRKWHELKQALTQLNLGDKNYEISIMGGVLTMRIEQHPRPLIDVQSLEPPKALPSAQADVLEEDKAKKGELAT